MGRPKGSKNKKNKKEPIAKVKSVKRKIGRPKGSVSSKVKIKGKVGRPKKVELEKKKPAYSKYNSLPDDYIQPKTYKVAGYCPVCDLCIMSNDFVSKTVFECPCGIKRNKKYLKKKSERAIQQEKDDARTSKVEYLRAAAKKTKDLEKHHTFIHPISDIPDVSIMSMSEVKEDM